MSVGVTSTAGSSAASMDEVHASVRRVVMANNNFAKAMENYKNFPSDDYAHEFRDAFVELRAAGDALRTLQPPVRWKASRIEMPMSSVIQQWAEATKADNKGKRKGGRRK